MIEAIESGTVRRNEIAAREADSVMLLIESAVVRGSESTRVTVSESEGRESAVVRILVAAALATVSVMDDSESEVVLDLLAAARASVSVIELIVSADVRAAVMPARVTVSVIVLAVSETLRMRVAAARATDSVRLPTESELVRSRVAAARVAASVMEAIESLRERAMVSRRVTDSDMLGTESVAVLTVETIRVTDSLIPVSNTAGSKIELSKMPEMVSDTVLMKTLS